MPIVWKVLEKIANGLERIMRILKGVRKKK